MTFRVVRTNQYNQDLGLIHSTNGNHLENPKEGSSIDHQLELVSSNPMYCSCELDFARYLEFGRSVLSQICAIGTRCQELSFATSLVTSGGRGEQSPKCGRKLFFIFSEFKDPNYTYWSKHCLGTYIRAAFRFKFIGQLELIRSEHRAGLRHPVQHALPGTAHTFAAHLGAHLTHPPLGSQCSSQHVYPDQIEALDKIVHQK
ncbi:hypothetical protein F511_02967 [Dorcoceras hygrometricum]|uniref:Uncharacterized protein n=1 Tax=Dorcoceras hygrometricum TaxID=472368 RepID=A0A2Z7BL59_9LAMI|nr:hypothetical protein F511_02967 [Dorcoceras hygrometricum]